MLKKNTVKMKISWFPLDDYSCANIIHYDKNIFFEMSLTIEKKIIIVHGETAINMTKLTFLPVDF